MCVIYSHCVIMFPKNHMSRKSCHSVLALVTFSYSQCLYKRHPSIIKKNESCFCTRIQSPLPEASSTSDHLDLYYFVWSAFLQANVWCFLICHEIQPLLSKHSVSHIDLEAADVNLDSRLTALEEISDPVNNNNGKENVWNGTKNIQQYRDKSSCRWFYMTLFMTGKCHVSV